MPEPTSVGENPIKIGSLVRWTGTGDTGAVRSINDGLAWVDFATGNRLVAIDQLVPLPNNPLDDLLQGNIGWTAPYGLRLQALYLKHAYRFDPCAGLSNARIEPALHQVYVANRVVSKKLRPRMILADEVGLGKTIEAGLVIKELRARGLADRVLVITPASLTQQWHQELRSKFNEEFEVIDGTTAKYLSKDGGNPWRKRDNVISSLEFARLEKNSESITEAHWDLVIFDEAHRLRRQKIGKRVNTTLAYRLADQLKKYYGLLLLTATPMQLDPFELHSLIELIEPGLYSTEEYDELRELIPGLNDRLKYLLEWEELRLEKQTIMKRVFPSIDLDREEGRSEAEERIIKEHPHADILIRNRKSEIGGFTKRKAKTYKVTQTQEEFELYQDITEYISNRYNRALQAKQQTVGFAMVTYQKLLASSSYALYEGFKRRIERLEEQTDNQSNSGNQAERGKNFNSYALEETREAEDPADLLNRFSWEDDIERARALEEIQKEINELRQFVNRLENIRDSKALELLCALQKVPSEQKILLFTQYMDTQEFLRHTLEINGYNIAIFNGKMNLEEKEMSVKNFRKDSRILITTEAGGEGRNFQFSSTMFNYDLPWNPMKIEQRIGRLDRIGQKSNVHIYNFACRDTVEEQILYVLDKRIRLFEESVGSLDPILGEVERNIERLILTRDDESFDKYLEDIESNLAKARRTERIWNNLVMDRASFRRDIASEILENKRLASPSDLKNHTKQSLEFYGGWLNEHKSGGQIIQLPDKLRRQLNLNEKASRGCFEPQSALEHEELPFFAFGNPLIDAVVDLPVEAQPPAWTCSRVIEGTTTDERLEVFYELTTQGVRPFGIMIRHLVDHEGRLEEHTVNSMPEIGTDSNSREMPDWLPRAIKISRNKALSSFENYRKKADCDHDKWKRGEINRAIRIYNYRKVKLEQDIKEEQKFISSLEQTGTDEERRVLPARRGLLKRLREQLDKLESDHAAAVENILNRPSIPAMKVLSAGLMKIR